MIEEVVFPDEWEKNNVLPIRKINSKNYRPIFH